MMTLFKWDASFLTHLERVDHQHHQLIDLINHLARLVGTGVSIDTATYRNLGDQIIAYCDNHFADEEQQMREAGIDARHFEAHCSAHAAFAQEVRILCDAGLTESVNCAQDLLRYLIDWLAHHILTMDRVMAQQLRAIEAGDTTEPLPAESPGFSITPLVAALQTTLAGIVQRNLALQAMNEELEKRIAERTKDLEASNQRLQALSIEDELTGLPNRRHAMLSLDRLWAESRRNHRPFCLLLIDADDFKQVNDLHGHATGDIVLQELAGRLRAASRSSDIVCRLGGDEFLVICPGASTAQAVELARRILVGRSAVSRTGGPDACWNGQVSIGIAQAGDDTERPGDLLRAADEAMYAAKHNGGGYQVFNSRRA